MPKIRYGTVNSQRQAAQVVVMTDVAALIAAAQAAKSVPELRQTVSNLAQVVQALAEAAGLREAQP